jgi:ornithine decarboxylase
VRPDAVSVAARWFQAEFKGDVFYAVKANPSPWVIRELVDAGVRSFDVASLNEIELVGEHAPGSRMAFMHPVKSRVAISAAYFDHGVRTFSFDTHEELAKILDATGQAKDLNLIVRMGVQAEGAAYSLSGKFGVEPHNAPALLLAARRATQDLMGVSFHVGSQCMRPTAYQAAMAQASRALVRAGVLADVVDVGGGFPSIYPGMVPPDMSEYLAAIDRGFSDMMVHETTQLWCEPGRALVAEASSLLVKVELKKGDALYLNDGSYGSLFDAAHMKWPFPVKAYRKDGGEVVEEACAPSASTAPPATASTTCRARSTCPTASTRATTSRSACWAPMAWRCRPASTALGRPTPPRCRTPRWPRCTAWPSARSRPRGPKPRNARSCASRAPRARRARSAVVADPSLLKAMEL